MSTPDRYLGIPQEAISAVRADTLRDVIEKRQLLERFANSMKAVGRWIEVSGGQEYRRQMHEIADEVRSVGIEELLLAELNPGSTSIISMTYEEVICDAIVSCLPATHETRVQNVPRRSLVDTVHTTYIEGVYVVERRNNAGEFVQAAIVGHVEPKPGNGGFALPFSLSRN